MKKLTIVLVSLSIVCAGCSKRIPRTDTFVGQNMQVGTIKVIVDDLVIGEDRNEVFDKVQGENQIKGKLEDVLTKGQLISPASDVDMIVRVDGFRLRHGATRFFTGAWSGSDYLQGQITVNRGTHQILAKRIEVAGGNGNPFNISRDSRAEGLIRAFCSSILNTLRNDSVSSPAATAQALPTKSGKHTNNAEKIVAPNQSSSPELAMGPCTLEQALSMKSSGLSDSQIRAACGRAK